MSLNTLVVHQILNELKNKRIDLLAVSKTRTVQDIIALNKLGVINFGENRVQEADKKFSNLGLRDKINLHLIGPLQSNKIKKALEIFDVIQSIDKYKTIDLIEKLISANSKAKKFYLQINVGMENQKSGIGPDETYKFYNYAINKNLNVEGLMCIPPANENPEKYFLKLHNIKLKINPKLKLSMGMSNDYKIAIKCKTDIVRLGSILFE